MVKSVIKYLFFVWVIFISNKLQAQENENAIIFHITSAHTSFPDTGRSKGHFYDGKLYSAQQHYQDSSVLIVVPKNLSANKKVDLIYWFHGWGNHIDSAAVRYELIKQFIASKRNAVLVLPETAFNAPDSYGGKLENKGEFKLLNTDVLNALKAKQIADKNCVPGNIILAGHSGAYRVMAFIIQNGGLPIEETMLFDALYGQTDKFMDWLKGNRKHRFIHLFTNYGEGTLEESKHMVQLLADEKIAYIELEEKDLTKAILKNNRLIFIHSLKPHNDIINPTNFRLMLENSSFLKGKD